MKSSSMAASIAGIAVKSAPLPDGSVSVREENCVCGQSGLPLDDCARLCRFAPDLNSPHKRPALVDELKAGAGQQRLQRQAIF
jgi:hypothetical protein